MLKLPREIWITILEMKSAAWKRDLFQKRKAYLEDHLEFPIINFNYFIYYSEYWHISVTCHKWVIKESPETPFPTCKHRLMKN